MVTGDPGAHARCPDRQIRFTLCVRPEPNTSWLRPRRVFREDAWRAPGPGGYLHLPQESVPTLTVKALTYATSDEDSPARLALTVNTSDDHQRRPEPLRRKLSSF